MPKEPVDQSIGKLGKHKVKRDKRTLVYSNYVRREHMPGIPDAKSWTKKQKGTWGMMDNWTLCDCTCAGAAHMVQCWTLNTGNEITIPTKDIIKAYSDVSGYDPKTKKHDDGANMLDLLNHWRKVGVGGHKILAYATVDHRNTQLVRDAIYLFGGIYVGIQLPKSIAGQHIWDVPATGLKGAGRVNSLGGHAVAVLDYDNEGVTCITWGKQKKMTWAFWKAYVEESYAVLSPEFLKKKKTPAGFDLVQLEQDLMNITHKRIQLSKELKPETSKTAVGPNGGRGGIKEKKLTTKIPEENLLGQSGKRGGVKGGELKKEQPQKKVLGHAGTKGGVKGSELKKNAPKKKVMGNGGKKS